MITTSTSSCVFCRYEVPINNYELDGLMTIKEIFSHHNQICDTHKTQMDAKIQELSKPEPKKVILKVGKINPFLPKSYPIKPSFYEREPGCDDD